MVVPNSDEPGPAVSDWIRIGDNQFAQTTYVLRSRPTGSPEIERSYSEMAYDSKTGTWSTATSYIQYLDQALNVTAEQPGPLVQAIRFW